MKRVKQNMDSIDSSYPLSVRAFHFDMKGLIPRADFLITLLPAFAKMGYNTILLELEDKFPYRFCPVLAHPDAWTRKDFAHFRDAAADNGIELVPLLQTAGHMDYILKHPEYKELREGIVPHETTSQWCLKDSEKIFRFWKKLADELLDFFPGKYFHIGADEFNFKIPCDRCSCEERFDLFIHHVLRCANYIRDHNRRPIVWDDTFRHREGLLLDQLLKIAIPCVWQYRTIDEKIIRRIAGKTQELWGASKIQNDSTYRGMGSQKLVEKNVDDWQKILRKYPQFTGHIGTIWGRDHGLSPLAANLPQSFYMLAYLGKALSSPEKIRRVSFQKKFAKDYFGLPSMALIDMLGVFPEKAALELKKAQTKATAHQSILAIWRKWNEIDHLWQYCDECFGYDSALFLPYLQGTVENDLTENFLDGVRITKERAVEWKKSLLDEMSRYFPKGLLNEFSDSRIEGMLMINEVWRKVICKAHKLRNHPPKN